jgi:hypothetical protein
MKIKVDDVIIEPVVITSRKKVMIADNYTKFVDRSRVVVRRLLALLTLLGELTFKGREEAGSTKLLEYGRDKVGEDKLTEFLLNVLFLLLLSILIVEIALIRLFLVSELLLSQKLYEFIEEVNCYLMLELELIAGILLIIFKILLLRIP